MCNFLPTKLEYNKYIEVINIYNPRTTNRKSNSFNSTFNSSEMPKKGENIETDDKFVRTPTEILIVCNNRNNLVNNNLTKVNKKEENNINNINNDNSNNNENKLNLSFDDTISISTKRVILPEPKNNNFKDD